MDILNGKSEEVISFFSALGKMLDNIQLALKNKASNDNRLLTSKEVCKLLCISPRTLQEWRNTGKIPFIKIGEKVLYKWSEIINIFNR
ncbi:excisionase family DNA binding protein [Dysgonomonas sp. PFB1-18]|uniref:helix-turn-helix domain-containing protein n=1 Tax=unclassified Dysgonomonas TaxID=2630389 RepID=UPI002476F4F9|nr:MULTISPECIES: helix-turn-helix domain-containing protein [unclassified Dysgonomonas]MDH6309431.1 excisionase family DNA binding protein [Dysgonomonas sp. PF1-14]MDH6339704.1 excisionase family DNA binding protein [Dysgonomonas sp. PF1-16]MDH6381352.1 excisionase family DNA binding protein [Dysgonomonas sp. PFB1-18]MDH6398567.1 excisionase family DNA binding protein [Dysgonomonas sp. PF1-23]